jgi:hypothetical protein
MLSDSDDPSRKGKRYPARVDLLRGRSDINILVSRRIWNSRKATSHSSLATTPPRRLNFRSNHQIFNGNVEVGNGGAVVGRINITRRLLDMPRI